MEMWRLKDIASIFKKIDHKRGKQVLSALKGSICKILSIHWECSSMDRVIEIANTLMFFGYFKDMSKFSPFQLIK